MNPYQHRPEDGLIWFPERRMGFYPVQPNGTYNAEYFAKYQGYAQTVQGRAITQARVSLVDRYVRDPEANLLDIGIGCGDFLQAWRGPGVRAGYGFDVNPMGVAWLEGRELFADPLDQSIRAGRWDVMTFWDSLEHIASPAYVLDRTRWAFLTLPIFTGPDHVLRSKHFRRDEHFWYFTRRGLIDWFGAQGFDCLEHNTMEQLLGREDVETFVFRRP